MLLRKTADNHNRALSATRLLALAVVALTAGIILSILVTRWSLQPVWEYAGEALSQFYAVQTPETVQMLAEGCARIFLSPMLYLLVLGVFIAEKWIPARNQRFVSRGTVHDFLAWFVLDGLLLRTVADVAYLALLYSLYDRYLSYLRVGDALATSIPTYARVVGALVIADFALWWHHFFMHKLKFFWVFHSVHHSQRELNMFTNLRFHVGEVLVSRTIRYTPLYLLNLDFELAVWIPVVIEAYERVYHANLRTAYGPLKYILVTPQSHRVHHSADRRHVDKNFGILFSFWDRLFGTLWADYDEYPGTGIHDPGFPDEQSATTLGTLGTYFSQFAYPFACLIQAARGEGWELGPRDATHTARDDSLCSIAPSGRQEIG